jgi:hypothetical protein
MQPTACGEVARERFRNKWCKSGRQCWALLRFAPTDPVARHPHADPGARRAPGVELSGDSGRREAPERSWRQGVPPYGRVGLKPVDDKCSVCFCTLTSIPRRSKADVSQAIPPQVNSSQTDRIAAAPRRPFRVVGSVSTTVWRRGGLARSGDFRRLSSPTSVTSSPRSRVLDALWVGLQSDSAASASLSA